MVFFFGHDLDVYLTVLRAESLLHTWNVETLCVFYVFATPVSWHNHQCAVYWWNDFPPWNPRMFS